MASVLETAMARARLGQLTMQSVLWTFAASTLYVPSGADPGETFKDFQPVLLPKDDHSMVAVFTSPQEAERVGHLAPFIVAMSGSQLLLQSPATHGLVVNPGSNLGFAIEPAGIAKFRTELVP